MSKRPADCTCRTSHSNCISTLRRKKRKTQNNYEPVCPATFERFKECSFLELMRSISRFYHTDWTRHPCRQFYYGCCKQIFVRRVCKSGKLGKLAFDTIETIKKTPGRQIDDIIDISVFYELDNVVNIFF